MAKDSDGDQVTIYEAEWCPPCHVTKQYLDSIKVKYKYVNVDEDREAGIAVTEKTGWRAIPIIKIGEEYLLGFDRPKIDQALRAAKLMP